MTRRLLVVALVAPLLALARPSPAAAQVGFGVSIGLPFFGAYVGVPAPYYAPPVYPAYPASVYCPPAYVPAPVYGAPVYYGGYGYGGYGYGGFYGRPFYGRPFYGRAVYGPRRVVGARFGRFGGRSFHAAHFGGHGFRHR